MANFFNPYQQNYMQQQFTQPQVNNTVLVVPVQGEAGANIYPVAAGNTVFLIDFATKTFWIKATDVNGIPSRFEAYEFKNKIIPQVQPTQGNNFVSQAEFDELKNQLQQLTASLNGFISKGENLNATVNAKSSNVSAEVQRICEQISEQQNESSANGTATVE